MHLLNIPLYEQYSSVIEYNVSPGNVEWLKEEQTVNPVYYLRHRATIKEERLTTKLRVVFEKSFHA